MSARPDIEAELFDVAEFSLPQGDYGMGIKDQFPQWRDTMPTTVESEVFWTSSSG